MDLSEALTLLPRLGYDRSAPKTQEAQQALYQLRREPPDGLPIGLEVRVSGQGINLPVVPWITLLDPGVTKRVTEGLYLVYLFSSDLQTVFLSMNQGATAHKALYLDAGLSERAAERAALEELRQEASAIRANLEAEFPGLPSDPVELGSDLWLPRAYEAASMTSLAYTLDDLPPEMNLREDLSYFNQIYQRAVAIKDQLVAGDPSRFRTASRARSVATSIEMEPIFRPKDGAEYVIHAEAQRRVVRPRHEALIRAFGKALTEVGWTPATNVHPRDLTATRGNVHWLIEAKTVGTNPEFAVREAIGQLFAYRHFYYRQVGQPDPELLALFSDPVGDAFLHLLTGLGIEAVWRTAEGWASTAESRDLLPAR